MKIWQFFFCNFMWLYILHAIVHLTGAYAFVLTFFMLLCFLGGVFSFPRLRCYNSLDLLVLAFVIYIFLNTIAIDYPNHLEFLIFAFFFQFCPLLCYFIARTNDLELETIFKKMMVPITIIMVLGLYFHLAQPEWYSAAKWAVLYDRYGAYMTEDQIQEHMRLTSIFNSSYYVAYATFFYSAYLLYALTFKELNKGTKFLYMSLLLLSVVVLLFANHRSTILGFLITYLYCFLKGKNKVMRSYMIFGALLIAAITVVIIFSSEEYLHYITMRFEGVTTEEGFEGRFEHTRGEQDILSVFGGGYGRYSIRAREYGGWSLIDSQYQNVLGELGIVGLIFFILILFVASYKGVHYNKRLRLELCVFLFFVPAFLGASALTIDSEYSFIFWYVLGKISLKSSHKSFKVAPLALKAAV